MTVAKRRERLARHNWGRWGERDERGAANLLDAKRVTAAARLASSGRVFQLGLPLGAATATPPRRTAPAHDMDRHAGHYAARTTPPRAQFADDSIRLAVHTGSHVDALAHVWYGEQLYNGFPRESVAAEGALHCGVEQLGPIVARGVLLDFAEEGPLEDDRAITAAELEQRAEEQGVEVGAGDVVLVRTGWWSAYSGRPGQTFEREPGPDLEAACWLAERDVAAVGADNFAFEVMPSGLDSVFAVHELLLRDCGIPILEGLALDELAHEWVYEFLFVAAPLQLVGATGSPVNPLAIT